MKDALRVTIFVIACLPLVAAVGGVFAFGYMGIFQHSDTYGGAAAFTGFIGIPVGMFVAMGGFYVATEARS